MGSNKYPLIPPPGGGTPSLPGTGQPAPMQPGEFGTAATPNLVSFALQQIDPPAGLYIQRDDQLQIFAFTNQGSDNLFITGRVLLAAPSVVGQPSDSGHVAQPPPPKQTQYIQPISQTLALGPTRLSASSIIPLAEGYLLNLALQSLTADTRGMTFARAFLIKGSGGNGINTAQLIGDYTSGFQLAAWPGGRIISPLEGPGWMHTIQQANPAAGADWIFSPVTDQRVRVDSFSAIFVASASAGNRAIEIIVDDGANTVWRTSVPVNVTAGQSVTVSGTGTNQPTGVVATTLTVAIPPGLIMPEGWRLRSSTTGILGGDQWGAIWLNVEEWLDD